MRHEELPWQAKQAERLRAAYPKGAEIGEREAALRAQRGETPTLPYPIANEHRIEEGILDNYERNTRSSKITRVIVDFSNFIYKFTKLGKTKTGGRDIPRRAPDGRLY